MMVSDIREAFEALEQAKNKFEMCGATFEFDTIKAALSANGGEAPTWTAEDEPVAYLTWHQVMHAIDDYEEVVALSHKDDRSADGTPAFPVYTHPAPPSVAVPEGLIDEIKREIGFANAGAESHKGVAGEQLRAICIGKSQALQYVLSALTAAPSPDHIPDAGKVVPVAIPESEFDETNPIHQAADAYSYACEIMEQHQAKRVNAGKDPGTIGSLCDGLAWLYGKIEELEDAPSVPENEKLQKAIADDLELWLSQVRHMEGLSAHDIIESAEDYISMLRTAGDEGEG